MENNENPVSVASSLELENSTWNSNKIISTNGIVETIPMSNHHSKEEQENQNQHDALAKDGDNHSAEIDQELKEDIQVQSNGPIDANGNEKDNQSEEEMLSGKIELSNVSFHNGDTLLPEDIDELHASLCPQPVRLYRQSDVEWQSEPQGIMTMDIYDSMRVLIKSEHDGRNLFSFIFSYSLSS